MVRTVKALPSSARSGSVETEYRSRARLNNPHSSPEITFDSISRKGANDPPAFLDYDSARLLEYEEPVSIAGGSPQIDRAVQPFRHQNAP